MDVAFISNGIALDEDKIAVLKTIEPVVFGLSMDAAESYMHDYIRSFKGCFEHLMWAIPKLQENGIEPSIVTTVHKLNYSQLPKIRDLLIKLGVKYWQIQYADFIGRMPCQAMITEGQFWAVAEFIADIKANYPQLDVTGSDVTGYMSDFARSIQGNWYGCQAGIKVLGIGSDGSIRGCLSQQLDKFIEGNVRDTSLVDLWNNPNKFEYNRHFDCSMLSGYCKTCRYGAICKGGCSIAASAQQTDGCRCNPYCLYKIEKEGFSDVMQARTKFDKDEISQLYDPIKKLPEDFYKNYIP